MGRCVNEISTEITKGIKNGNKVAMISKYYGGFWGSVMSPIRVELTKAELEMAMKELKEK